MKEHLLFTGLGAGNIGDEAMFEGFLSSYPLSPGSTVEVYDTRSPILRALPQDYHYLDFHHREVCRAAARSAERILLVGGTPVVEDWGLDWPMRFIATELDQLGSNKAQVHAVAPGVDRLMTPEAIALFKESFSHVNTWTVRSQSCRDSLLVLGVPDSSIRVGADLAWLLSPASDAAPWAAGFLTARGIDPEQPILGVNVVNERWAVATEVKSTIAHVLDQMIREFDLQVAFFCNETREGDYFDAAAARGVAQLMREKSIQIPNRYFTPSQMVGLLSHCALTLSQRYHFTLLSILAGTVPLSFARGQKMTSLLADLGEEPVGSMESCDPAALKDRIETGLRLGHTLRKRHQERAAQLRLRATENFFFLHPPSTTPKGASSFLGPVADRRDEERSAQESTSPHSCPLPEGKGMISVPTGLSKSPSGHGRKRDRRAQLASVSQLESVPFRDFMRRINRFASLYGLRQFTDWSKVWEYPWLWFNGLHSLDWSRVTLLDLGSELSPMPWLLASLGARVTLVETDTRWIDDWERIRNLTGFDVSWHIAQDEGLPIDESTFDGVTSFSVIEHQRDKDRAINEVARVLKAGGLFALSFDICEPEMGMTFPEWNGRALTLGEFEQLVWAHPAFEGGALPIRWNTWDCSGFVEWNLKSAPYHNYTVAGAVLTKKALP